jgi:hypothetical protein
VLHLVSEDTIEQRLHAGRENAEINSKNRLARVRALIPPSKPKAAPPVPLDPAQSFCDAASQLLQGALVSCEERFPAEGEASVLLVVVESDAAHWRERLRSLEAACFRPGVLLTIEVLDRAAADLLRRLAESGVISPSIHASRQLYPPPSVSDEEQERARAHQLFAGLKAKLAEVKNASLRP